MGWYIWHPHEKRFIKRSLHCDPASCKLINMKKNKTPINWAGISICICWLGNNPDYSLNTRQIQDRVKLSIIQSSYNSVIHVIRMGPRSCCRGTLLQFTAINFSFLCWGKRFVTNEWVIWTLAIHLFCVSSCFHDSWSNKVKPSDKHWTRRLSCNFFHWSKLTYPSGKCLMELKMPSGCAHEMCKAVGVSSGWVC